MKKKPTPTPVTNSPVVVAAAAAAAVANEVEILAITANNVNDLPGRAHKCTIASCDKEFRIRSHLARHYAQAHGIALRSGSPRPIMKTRTAFYLQTTGVTKLSRRLCYHVIRSKKAARQPSYSINVQAVKLECEFVEQSVFRNGISI